jgi:hypothetical protein
MVGFKKLRGRCVMTTYDPDTLEHDPTVLRRIVQEMGARLALDSYVVRGGELPSGIHWSCCDQGEIAHLNCVSSNVSRWGDQSSSRQSTGLGGTGMPLKVDLEETSLTIESRWTHSVFDSRRVPVTEVGSERVDAETYGAFNRAVREAVRRINANKRAYLHYFIDHHGQDDPEIAALTIDDLRESRLVVCDPAPIPLDEMQRTTPRPSTLAR